MQREVRRVALLIENLKEEEVAREERKCLDQSYGICSLRKPK